MLFCLRLCPSCRTEVVNQALTVHRCEGMVKLYRPLSLFCQNTLWGIPDVSTALWSVHPNRFSRAPLLSGCVRSLHQPFSVLPCVYKLFASRALSLLISHESSSDALNICGAQRHLLVPSASIFRQASTLFELHSYCRFLKLRLYFIHPKARVVARLCNFTAGQVWPPSSVSIIHFWACFRFPSLSAKMHS